MGVEHMEENKAIGGSEGSRCIERMGRRRGKIKTEKQRV